MGLVKPDGFVGLLTPSGIYADKTAARFFKSVSTSGRVGGLFDFENRRLGTGLRPSFPTWTLGSSSASSSSEERTTFDETECAFFSPTRTPSMTPNGCFPLAPDDFARVNPNRVQRPSSERGATRRSPAVSMSGIPFWCITRRKVNYAHGPSGIDRIVPFLKPLKPLSHC